MDFGFLFDAGDMALGKGGADASSSWVQIAKTGTFKDPRYGSFKITTREFSKWVSNFHSLVLDKGRLGLPADIDHSPEKRGETEAVGWIKDLDVRGDELWARVEWNTLGKELIAERRYAYISPSYSNDYKDETGASHGTALLGIALTNRPFLQMATVNLSAFTFAQPQADGDADDVGLQSGDLTDLDSEILDVSMPERQAHAVVVKKVNGKTRHMFPIPPGDHLHARLAKAFIPRAIAAGHITEQEAASVRQRADAVLGSKKPSRQHSAYSPGQMDTKTLLDGLGLTHETLKLAADADDATVLAAIKAHQAPAPTPPAPTPPTPEGGVTLSAEQVATLLAQAAAGAAAAKELKSTRFDTAFNAAQQAGKVTAAQRETFLGVYQSNEELGLKVLTELQPVIPMQPAGHGGAPMDLDPAAATLAGEYTDIAAPDRYAVDTRGLKVLAAAGELQAANPAMTFEAALARAESQVAA